MTWINDYRVGYIDTDGTAQPTTLVSGFTASSGAVNAEIEKSIVSGSPFPLEVFLNTSRPVFSLTTLEVATAFDNMGFNSRCVTGMEVFLQKRNCDATAMTNGIQYTLAEALLVPTTLTVNHRGNAEVSYDVYLRSTDGITEPITRTVISSYAAPQPQKRYLMDKGQFSGTAFDGKRSITLNWNPDVTQEGADSTMYDTVTSINSEQPVAVFRGVDESWFNTLASDSLSGSKGARADTFFYLRQRGLADVVTAHIKISMDAMLTFNTLFDATTDAPAETEMQWDSYVADPSGVSPVNLPLDVQTGVAIT